MKVMLRWHRGPAHDRVGIFIGPDRDHLSLAGYLTMEPDEAEAFRTTVRSGIAEPGIIDRGFTGIFERGWGDE